jgi:hypothetical protein
MGPSCGIVGASGRNSNASRHRRSFLASCFEARKLLTQFGAQEFLLSLARLPQNSNSKFKIMSKAVKLKLK